MGCGTNMDKYICRVISTDHAQRRRQRHRHHFTQWLCKLPSSSSETEQSPANKRETQVLARELEWKLTGGAIKIQGTQ